jgi:nucleoside-diphosphate-sugar epimerase
MRTVLLSGASGFIAQKAAEQLISAGYRVVGISHTTLQVPHFDAVYEGLLSRSLTGVFQEDIDVFIHCAYHAGEDDYAINVEGTRMWARQAEKNGVMQQVFLSSISARPASSSSYSRAKHELENWFVDRGYTIFRLGLTVGDGGLFRRMVDMVKKAPVLPLLDGGRSPVYVAGIQDVCKALLVAAETGSWTSGKAWNLFQTKPVSLREILGEIKKNLGKKGPFVPVPAWLALGAVRFVERLPLIKLGISSNNIIGLKQNVSLDWESDYTRFGFRETPLEELVAGAL